MTCGLLPTPLRVPELGREVQPLGRGHGFPFLAPDLAPDLALDRAGLPCAARRLGLPVRPTRGAL